MARLLAQKKPLFYEPDDTNDDAILGCDLEGEKVECLLSEKHTQRKE